MIIVYFFNQVALWSILPTIHSLCSAIRESWNLSGKVGETNIIIIIISIVTIFIINITSSHPRSLPSLLSLMYHYHHLYDHRLHHDKYIQYIIIIIIYISARWFSETIMNRDIVIDTSSCRSLIECCNKALYLKDFLYTRWTHYYADCYTSPRYSIYSSSFISIDHVVIYRSPFNPYIDCCQVVSSDKCGSRTSNMGDLYIDQNGDITKVCLIDDSSW